MRGRRAPERGAGTVLVVVAAAVVLSAGCTVTAWGSALAARQRAEGAADLAALAGARHALAGGDGCAVAAAVARRSGAHLAACASGAEGDLRVTVEVLVPWAAGLDVPPARARARAGVPRVSGPPSGAGDPSRLRPGRGAGR